MTQYLLTMLLQRLPILLVLLGGIVFAIVRWRRHPKVSLMTVIGLVLYITKVLLFTLLSYSVPRFRETMHWSYAAANNIFEVLNILSDVSFAIIIVLLVTAAFVSRRPAFATGS
jgi:hypothetical protein